jgi:hypothetical protein
VRYHYPVSATRAGRQLSMGHFTTVNRSKRFYDEAEGIWAKEKQRILKSLAGTFPALEGRRPRRPPAARSADALHPSPALNRASSPRMLTEE